jgi:membrane-bound lytic murein transglycosylase F
VYFCNQIAIDLKHNRIFILLISSFLISCHHKQERVMTPWGEEIGTDINGSWKSGSVTEDESSFDLDDIVHAGELIVLTIAGPQTCYDYHGSRLGMHVMLCQKLADSLGVRLRTELCRDTLELRTRLDAGEADLIAYPISSLDSIWPGWIVSSEKIKLKETIRHWYDYRRIAQVQQEEQRLLSTGGVRRKVFAPMQNRGEGIISRYDAIFQKHCLAIRWDWRLMAAQCYQESTFDPNAISWAGARGLMQIMPQTADHLGLARTDLNNPEKNIAAAARYLSQLEESFKDIQSRNERQNFVLAAYNGGSHHIRDAMALARNAGHNQYRWSEVSEFVLKLSQPQYYQDPVVKYGYMRGSETVDYVQKIRDRYQQYRGVKAKTQVSSMPQKSRNAKHRKKFNV